MQHRSGPRLVALLVAAIAAVAVIVPTAGASDQLVNKLTVGAVFVNQPKGQAWTMKLHLKGDLIDLVDEVELPQSTDYLLQFPKGKLNGSRFPVCRATASDFEQRHAAACPADTQVGQGHGTAYGIGIHYENVPLYFFNGAGTDGNRKIIAYGRVKKGGIDVDVPWFGTIKRTSSGFTADFPVPVIKLSDDEFAAIQGFDFVLYRTIRKRGRVWSYIEAPTVCTDPGFRFSFTATFKTGRQVTDTTTIPCELRGV